MKTKFEFDEVVKVTVLNDRIRKIYGREGWVSGKSYADDGSNKIGYSISFPEGSWFVFENEIESTGKFVNSEDHKSVDSVRVRVLPDGSGELIEKSGDEDEKI